MHNSHYPLQIEIPNLPFWMGVLLLILGGVLGRLLRMRSHNERRRRMIRTQTRLLIALLREVKEIKLLLQNLVVETNTLKESEKEAPPVLTPEEQTYQLEQGVIEEWEQRYRSLNEANQERLLDWNVWFRTLMIQWNETYASKSPTLWGPQSLTNLDVALYSPLEVPHGGERDSEPLRKMLVALREIRLQQLKEREVIRIEGVAGKSFAVKGKLEWDEIEAHLVAPPTPEEERKFHSILPGSGGYLYKGAVLKPTKAVFYGRWQAPSYEHRV